MTDPVNEALAAPAAEVTVKRPAMACAAVPAGGASLRPMVQVSPLFRVATVAQVLLEMATSVLPTEAVRAPVGVATVLVTVKTTSAPVAPAAIEPRAGPPATFRPEIFGVPVRAT